jgi:hypothetical protein
MGYDWTEHNYHGDSRVINAREQQKFNKGFDMKHMTFTFEVDNGEGDEPTVHTLPAKFEVCPTCEGRGKHVNPSIDAGGISEDDEFWQDDHDEEGYSLYHNGFYDVTCYTCNGRNVVPTIDRDRANEATLAIWDERCADDNYYDAESRAERMMGA